MSYILRPVKRFSAVNFSDRIGLFKSGYLCLCLHKAYLVENSERGSGMVSGMKRNGWCGRSQDLKSI